MDLPEDWQEALSDETREPNWDDLQEQVRKDRRQHTVYPSEDLVLNALRLTPFADTRVVILGQDPYHQPQQAHGLAFSVPDGVTTPPSLRKIQQELRTDLGVAGPMQGSLESWARQGVLLLNTTLTVRESEPGAHSQLGWDRFTDSVISVVSDKQTPVVFMLWGGQARAKKRLIDVARHCILEAAHPAARANARDPFLGSRPFSKANAFLERTGTRPIDWASISRPVATPGASAPQTAP